MLYQVSIVGPLNSYHEFAELDKAERLIESMLDAWHELGLAIERPLFPDAPVREWKGYAGQHLVRQMLLVTEEVNNDGDNS